MRNFCIDIGNTRVKAVLYEDGQELYSFDESHEDLSWQDWLDKVGSIDGIAVSNVSDRTDYYWMHHEADVFVDLNENTRLPFTNSYKTPETLGRDRIAAIAGAHALFPDQACCVIDIGTCVTYDFIDGARRYLGGNISPGVKLRLLAMHHFTDGLPLLEMKESDHLLGLTTETAMQNGAMSGLLYEIEGFLLRLEAKYNSFKTIFTGGGAESFARKLKTEIFVHTSLIPYGLNALLHWNK